MWKKRDIIRVAGIVVIFTGLVLARFLFLDYIPPESLIHSLERSWIVKTGMRRLATTIYGPMALILMAAFFKVVQERWPGRKGLKGLAFGLSIGMVWSFGFISGWAFLGTTLPTELLNSGVDLVGLSLGGWLIGLAVGSDVQKPQPGMWKPWLAVLFVALGFLSVHTWGTKLMATHLVSTADLLLVPTTPRHFLLLFTLGIWAGGMFVLLHSGLPFENTAARVAFFAFGVFGHSWTWFHLFFVIEFDGVLLTVVLVGLLGAVGVLVGALVYEGLAGGG